MNIPTTTRRHWLKNMSLAALASTATPRIVGAAPAAKLTLGLDAHSVRGMKWTAIPLIEYAAEQKLGAVLLNGLHYFETLDADYLQKVKALADSKGLLIRIGAGSISRGAKGFKDTFGTPEQALTKAVQVANILGSPTVNVRIGAIEDRYTPGGIEARMEEAISTMKAVRSLAGDAGIKFGFENHAGDTRTEEVLAIIEATGKDVCGAMLDPGNALWAMEDPMQQLRQLGPHVVCNSVRDYMVWESPEGATFQWTALGEGLMDLPAYVKLYQELCPTVPFFVETISNSTRTIPYRTEEFMKGFPKLKEANISAFQSLCRKGHALEVQQAPKGTDAKEFDRQHQKSEFTRSIAALRALVG